MQVSDSETTISAFFGANSGITLPILHPAWKPSQATEGGTAARRGAGLCRQATRTELGNFPTSSLSLLLSLDNDFAAERTCEEAAPVSLAPC